MSSVDVSLEDATSLQEAHQALKEHTNRVSSLTWKASQLS